MTETTQATILRLRNEATEAAQEEIAQMRREADEQGIPDDAVLEARAATPAPVYRLEPRPRNGTQTWVMPDLDAIRAEERAKHPMTDEIRAKLGGTKKLSEADIVAKYPHAVAGTLSEDGGHRTIEARLACGHTARLHTGDLWQVKKCGECKKK